MLLSLFSATEMTEVTGKSRLKDSSASTKADDGSEFLSLNELPLETDKHQINQR